MNKPYRQITVYVDPTSHDALAAMAKQQARSLSSLINCMIERETSGSKAVEAEILTTLKKTLIGVDGLLKYHEDKTLFSIVKSTRDAKLGGASDEG